ncbi:MAG: hypothetical protein WDW36_007254 [Sanguina aurantia]
MYVKSPRARPTTAERQALLWDSNVYSRVFLSEFSACTWYAWNHERGDPAQPYHYQHMVEGAEQAEKGARTTAGGSVLDLQQAKLVCGIAQQDSGATYQFSRSCGSAAQELRCLQIQPSSPPTHPRSSTSTKKKKQPDPKLQNLHTGSGSGSGFEVRGLEGAKAREPERLRRLFLLWHGRMRRAMTSPNTNYFPGLALSAPSLLAGLRSELLVDFKMGQSHLDLMRQLNVWTKVCEVSVAGSAARSGVDAGMGEGDRDVYFAGGRGT